MKRRYICFLCRVGDHCRGNSNNAECDCGCGEINDSQG